MQLFVFGLKGFLETRLLLERRQRKKGLPSWRGGSLFIIPAALMRKAPKLRPAAARSSRFRVLIDED